MFFGPHTQPTKMAMKKPPTGSMMFEVAKSKRSKKVFPSTLTSASTLLERAAVDPMSANRAVVIRVAVTRLI